MPESMSGLRLYRITPTFAPFQQSWATFHAKCAEEARAGAPHAVVVERRPDKTGPAKLGELCEKCGGA